MDLSRNRCCFAFQVFKRKPIAAKRLLTVVAGVNAERPLTR